MSNNKSWHEMTDEERDIIYEKVLSENQQQLFDLIDRWNITGVLLPKQNASDIKDGLLDLRPREVFAKIRTTMGPIKVYFRSESHVCTPLQMDLYTIRYTSLSQYTNSHPEARNNPMKNSFFVHFSRTIQTMMDFIGVDYTTLKPGKKYAMTEAVKELYDYLYDLKKILENDERMSSLKDLTPTEATIIYELLVNAFNSVPPLKDRKKPFKPVPRTASKDYTPDLNLDDQEIHRRYSMLSNFCKETDIQPFRGYRSMSPYVDAALYNLEHTSSIVGTQWRALSDTHRNYIKVRLNQKCSQFFDSFYNDMRKIIAEEYDDQMTPPKSTSARLGDVWRVKPKA